jgi:hypothetical protein
MSYRKQLIAANSELNLEDIEAVTSTEKKKSQNIE